MKNPKITVCIASYNGEKYIKQQLESILKQLSVYDEVIVSDDSSIDKTISEIETLCDSRIIILKGNQFFSPILNFENALKHANGDIIFMADQDDIWLPNKVSVVLSALEECDLVVHNCEIVDENLQPSGYDIFSRLKSRPGFIKNLLRNSYMGCCMAFRKSVLVKSIPFPKYISMHDFWIGMVANIYFRVTFVDEKLVLYRRHDLNASSTGEKSSYNIYRRILNRLHFLYSLTISALKNL